MGKNRKQQAVYDYLSGNKEVTGKLLISVKKMWHRHNWDLGEYRKAKRDILEREISKSYED